MLSTHDHQQGRTYPAEAELGQSVRNWRAAGLVFALAF